MEQGATVQQPAAEAPDDGRIVRPYALTGGRTRSAADGVELPFETLVVTTEPGRSATAALDRDRRMIASLCTRPLSVAELSAHLQVPLGVARVLVGDMTAAGLVEVHKPPTGTGGSDRPDLALLERVLDGIRAI